VKRFSGKGDSTDFFFVYNNRERKILMLLIQYFFCLFSRAVNHMKHEESKSNKHGDMRDQKQGRKAQGLNYLGHAMQEFTQRRLARANRLVHGAV
jgi:hypothetical protein